MPKKRSRRRERHRELVEFLVEHFQISTEKADAIARRYGPSRERCIAAAETLLLIRSLGLGS